MKRTFALISILAALSLLLSACGSAADNEAIIATSVALTVQAQATLTSSLDLPPSATLPADLTAVPTLTPAITPTTGSNPPSSPYANCTKANLVDENPPDGTIYKTGQKFFKTWRIQNSSSCVWDTTYKLVFWDGDMLGSGYVYNFPQTLGPGENAEVSIELTAPDTAGEYKGEWKLQTPDYHTFGVGQYSEAIWAQIMVVAANETPTYGITAVTYELARRPQAGCATNVFYTVTASVSFSGPIKEVILQFQHSDGFKASKIKIAVTEAGTLTFTDEWSFHLGATPGTKWIRLVQIFPETVEYAPVEFTYDCK
jgi:hypothetical protein